MPIGAYTWCIRVGSRYVSADADTGVSVSEKKISGVFVSEKKSALYL